ncbi:ABC transporter substrate-binding protein [Propionicicella superfundia]|uniref:ABC transporter substrate-binding protein n=1 Tax=Propionicicella superfundia TaxID=348582 RepID=UPI00146D7A99|nr:ABC transporter substrate-binding protein [Propionicicella superfundia]
MTVTNCGAEVTLDAAPTSIFIVNNDDIAILAELDALDLVVARTAEPVEGVYSDEVLSALKGIRLVATETGSTGGSIISIETILDSGADLVLAPENAVDRETLAASGVALYSPPAYCDNAGTQSSGAATFDLVYEQLRTFGTLLGKSELAEQRISELTSTVPTTSTDRGSAVALYVPTGGGTLYPYGAASMVTPVFAAAGLSNVYADTADRVFEVNIEDLLQKNPETVVLLFSDGTAETAMANFRAVAGVEALSAVKNNRIIALQFPFTDPPTPLSIAGVSKLTSALDDLP